MSKAGDLVRCDRCGAQVKKGRMVGDGRSVLLEPNSADIRLVPLGEDRTRLLYRAPSWDEHFCKGGS